MVLILDGNLEVTDLHVGVISVNDRFKEFDYIESSHKSDSFPPKIPIFLNACAKCSELPSNIMQLGKILSMFSSTVDTDFESEAGADWKIRHSMNNVFSNMLNLSSAKTHRLVKSYR